MAKHIRLKISRIKYTGDSIGRDIRVEIEVLGKFLSVDKKIKAGTTVEINQEVGRFETDQGLFQAEIIITVIEKDLLFNDVGNISGSIKVNTAILKPQQFVFEVQAKETRSVSGKFWGTKMAVFEITLEAIVLETIWYVSFEKGKNGWTVVRKEDDKITIGLPAYLKVKLETLDIKRQHFTILEGPWRDTRASVEIQKDGTSYF